MLTKTESELRQLFKNLSDCYADTWHSERGLMEEGEVIEAMTEDRFIEALKQANLLRVSDAIENQILNCEHDYRLDLAIGVEIAVCNKCGDVI